MIGIGGGGFENVIGNRGWFFEKVIEVFYDKNRQR